MIHSQIRYSLLVDMRYIALLSTSALVFSGCGSGTSESVPDDPVATTEEPSNVDTTSGPDGPTGEPDAPKSSPDRITPKPPAPTVAPSSKCPGKRLGQYTWGTELWRQGARELSDFFSTEDGKEWGCGDITINIGDFSAPEVIAYKEDIVPFIHAYRESSGNYESVVWLSYGDVVSGDSSLMLRFIEIFL
jgi:hypothetical protein